MNERIVKIRFPQILYKLYIILVILNYMIENSSVKGNYNASIIHNILVYFSLMLALLYIILNRYRRKEIIEIFALNLIGVICYLSSGKTRLLVVMLAITLLPEENLEKILKLIFAEELLAFSIIIVAALYGFLPNVIMETDKLSIQTTAMTLGFGHPNRLAAQATSLIFLYLCIKRNSIKKFDIIVSAVLSMIIFCITKSRTSLILSVMVLALISLQKKHFVRGVLFKVLPWSYMAVMAMIAIFIIMRALLGENNIFVHQINTLYNGRIDLAYRSILTYPITMFGKEIDLSKWTYFYYANDNGQVKILLEYGLAGFLSYFWIFQKALNNIKRSGEYIYAVIIVAFILWTTLEGNMYSIEWNFSMLFLSMNNLCSNIKEVENKESLEKGKHRCRVRIRV